MVAELAAPQLPSRRPPPGSIILDDLLRRYLVRIGLEDFHQLEVPEIKQYSLLALYRVVHAPKYGLDGITVEQFWEWVKPGDSYRRARLLPDTEEGHAYHLEQSALLERGEDGEETVILRKIDNVLTFTRKVFKNLVQGDLRANIKNEKVKGAVAAESSPSARRGNSSDEGQQSLDEILCHLREEREGADVEAARFVRQRVQAKMDKRQLRIVNLLDEYAPREVAEILSLDVSEVYAISRTYRSDCMKLWRRLFSTER